MTDRHYIACKFRETDSRSFTYHWDDAPFAVGDIVRVPDRSGDGWKRVHVVSVSKEPPSFPTKAIIGLHVDETESAKIDGAVA